MIHSYPFAEAGVPAAQADKVLILVHGRGGAPEDMISLVSLLNVGNAWVVAPRATGNTWYPHSFLAPTPQNQPWLDAALKAVSNAVTAAIAAGFRYEQIYFTGFSQGACLTLEYTTRNAQHYGGIIAFTGGLIGADLDLSNYQGNFSGTPIHLSAGDQDPHVPLSRIQETADAILAMHGNLQKIIYPGKPHSISGEEIHAANQHVFGSK